MKTIEIDDDIYRHLEKNCQGFGDTPNAVLRRLLNLDGQPQARAIVEPVKEPAPDTMVVGRQESGSLPGLRQAAWETPDSQPASATVPPQSPVNPPRPLAAHLTPAIAPLVEKLEEASSHTVVDRFLAILGYFHRLNPENFKQVLKVSGRGRKYFAYTISEIEKTGKSTQPKQIQGTPYYVVTNNDTPRKKTIISEVMTVLGYTKADIHAVCAVMDKRPSWKQALENENYQSPNFPLSKGSVNADSDPDPWKI